MPAYLGMSRGHGAIGLSLRRGCCCWRWRPVPVQRGELDVQVRREPVARAQRLQQLLRRRAAQAAVLHLGRSEAQCKKGDQTQYTDGPASWYVVDGLMRYAEHHARRACWQGVGMVSNTHIPWIMHDHRTGQCYCDQGRGHTSRRRKLFALNSCAASPWRAMPRGQSCDSPTSTGRRSCSSRYTSSSRTWYADRMLSFWYGGAS